MTLHVQPVDAVRDKAGTACNHEFERVMLARGAEASDPTADAGRLGCIHGRSAEWLPCLSTIVSETSQITQDRFARVPDR